MGRSQRRRILVLAGAVALAAPLRALGQRAAKTARIGMLMPVSQADATRNIDAFRQGLRDLGQVEGPGLSIETRFSEGKDERLPALAEELTKQKVDVIVTTSAGRRLSWTRS